MLGPPNNGRVEHNPKLTPPGGGGFHKKKGGGRNPLGVEEAQRE